MAGRVVWDQAALSWIERGAPAAAHKAGAQAGANAAADKIKSKATGMLAKTLSRPTSMGTYRSRVGSDLPYTSMEDRGGTIHGNPLLYIRGNRVGSNKKATRSKVGGKITAVKRSVPHVGKGFFDLALETYMDTTMATLRASL